MILKNYDFDNQINIIENKINYDFKKFNIKYQSTRAKGYKLTKNNNDIFIEYSTKNSFFSSLLSIISNKQDNFIDERELFCDNLGLMVDCARNAVMNIESLELFIVNAALMGYTYIKLYVEDCLKIDGEEFFGYMRGAYSKEQIKHIDAFCYQFGIELIPCIQTLAHYNQLFMWPEYKKIKDYDDILLVEDNRTYELLENIFKTVKECFTSKNINLGMDEAHMIGLGTYLDKNGYTDKQSILFAHLKKVLLLCKKYDYKPSIWSDMFFRLAFKEYYVYGKSFDKNMIDCIPEDLDLIYWDYYHLKEDEYIEMIKEHKQLTPNIKFAGGIWTWRGFVPYNKFTENTMFPAISACKKQNIKDMLFTMWGDNGGECSRFSVISSMLILSEKIYNENIDIKIISDKLLALTGYTYDEYLTIDLPNNLHNEEIYVNVNPSKYLLFSDPLISFFDGLINDNFSDYYNKYYAILKNMADKQSRYSYVFDTEAKLCKVLANKVNLSIDIKKYYDNKDISALKKTSESISEIVEDIKDFYDVFRIQWMKENKSFGFEVQDIRLGGLIYRMKHIQKILNDYCEGNLKTIDELEEERKTISIKPFSDLNNAIKFNKYTENVTVNAL